MVAHLGVICDPPTREHVHPPKEPRRCLPLSNVLARTTGWTSKNRAGGNWICTHPTWLWGSFLVFRGTSLPRSCCLSSAYGRRCAPGAQRSRGVLGRNYCVVYGYCWSLSRWQHGTLPKPKKLLRRRLVTSLPPAEFCRNRIARGPVPAYLQPSGCRLRDCQRTKPMLMRVLDRSVSKGCCDRLACS